MKIKKFAIVAILVVSCLLCACEKKEVETIEIPEVAGSFDFTVFKAGQADAIVLQTENSNIIIDCGEVDDGDEIVAYLKEKGISAIDYLFVTHFDKDHVGGFGEVIENVAVENIIVPDYQGNNEEYAAYVKTVSDYSLDITTLGENTAYTIDDVVFEVSTPKRKTYKEGDNDFSLVISVSHGENTFLFAGDAEKDRLSEVLREFGKPYDFLKVPHHGKYNDNTKRFVTTVKPAYSVICDSDKHPAEDETIDILEFAGSKVYTTKDGNVAVSSDGKEIKVTQ